MAGNTFNPTRHDQKQMGNFGPVAGRVSYSGGGPVRYIKDKIGGTMGPVDPMTNRVESSAVDITPDGKESQPLEQRLVTVLDRLEQAVNELKASHPVVRLRVQAVEGANAAIPVASNLISRSWGFFLSGKRVTAEKMMLQNNSSQTIYINWNEPATPGKCTVNPGERVNMEAEVDSINIRTATSNLEVNGDTAANIFIAAWGSSDQMYQKGAA